MHLLDLPSELLALVIGTLLPVDARMRVREVCACAKSTLDDRSLWRHLDVSASSGVVAPLTLKLLMAACARAGGTCLNGGQATLLSLDCRGAVCPAPLLARVVAFHHSLETLQLDDCAFTQFERAALGDLLAAGQQLRRLSLRALASPGSLALEDVRLLGDARPGAGAQAAAVRASPRVAAAREQASPRQPAVANAAMAVTLRRSQRLERLRSVENDKRCISLAALVWYRCQMRLT